MATGPEHYRDAERLLSMAHHWSYGDGGDPAIGQALATEAVGHATLALAAAMGTFGIAEETRTAADAIAWEYAAGEYTAQRRSEQAEQQQAAHDAEAEDDAMSASERFEHDQADEAKLDAEGWGQGGAPF